MNHPPLSIEGCDQTLQEEQPSLCGRAKTILFVEDNDLMREIGAQILEDLGYLVICAANGQEAYDIFMKTDHIDLVFTDVVMPEISGAALLQKIRATGSLVKAVAVTGHVLAEDLDRLREVGVKSIIRKPYDVDILADAVRDALENS
ncbi:MAG: response regulator [Anaerolineales bacterium]|jgi:CheY-like chemotaxis protein